MPRKTTLIQSDTQHVVGDKDSALILTAGGEVQSWLPTLTDDPDAYVDMSHFPNRMWFIMLLVANEKLWNECEPIFGKYLTAESDADINPKEAHVAWVVDECPNADGHWTIRLADGTATGNLEAEPIATVYALEVAEYMVEIHNRRLYGQPESTEASQSSDEGSGNRW